MTSQNLIRDFLAATPDSCRDFQPRCFDLLECPPVALQGCVSTTHVLPALDDDVAVLRVDLQAVAGPPVGLGRRQSCTAAEERVIDYFLALCVVQDRTAHQLHRFLRGMVEFLLIRSTHDELGRWPVPDREVLAGFPKPRRVLLSHIPARLMLIPIMCSR